MFLGTAGSLPGLFGASEAGAETPRRQADAFATWREPRHSSGPLRGRRRRRGTPSQITWLSMALATCPTAWAGAAVGSCSSQSETASKEADMVTAVGCAARAGELLTLQRLLDAGGDEVVNEPGAYGWRAVHEAAMAGHVGALELLIQRGAAMVVQEDDGRTPLHWAVLGGHLQVARRLLESGHPVNVADAAQGTPLHAVAVHEQEAMGELLLNAGADVTAQDGWHQTLLHQAAIMGQAPLVRLMLSRRAQIDLADADGTTPLQQAFLMAQAGLRGSGSVLSALLEGSVEDVDL
ncbi:unnamed protein product [Polarella glacialis]|uniref:Ankyrin repeat domain-containing protein n=1 Tax=Polarella glacialis TaxID=89957 RepID=A0A813H3R5_POLGL|nr:unnamed protein product [Polarella glacialis]